jgi:phosphoadenosine phosphosulfate reductase
VVLCPILYWTDEDVWQYIEEQKLPYCSLYDEGFTRLGCIGCPLGGPKSQAKEFARWPRYAKLWYRGITRYWEYHHGKNATRGPRKGTPYFSDTVADNAHDYFRWWIEKSTGKDDDKQCIMGMF